MNVALCDKETAPSFFLKETYDDASLYRVFDDIHMMSMPNGWLSGSSIIEKTSTCHRIAKHGHKEEVGS